MLGGSGADADPAQSGVLIASSPSPLLGFALPAVPALELLPGIPASQAHMVVPDSAPDTAASAALQPVVSLPWVGALPSFLLQFGDPASFFSGDAGAGGGPASRGLAAGTTGGDAAMAECNALALPGLYDGRSSPMVLQPGDMDDDLRHSAPRRLPFSLQQVGGMPPFPSDASAAMQRQSQPALPDLRHARRCDSSNDAEAAAVASPGSGGDVALSQPDPATVAMPPPVLPRRVRSVPPKARSVGCTASNAESKGKSGGKKMGGKGSAATAGRQLGSSGGIGKSGGGGGKGGGVGVRHQSQGQGSARRSSMPSSLPDAQLSRQLWAPLGVGLPPPGHMFSLQHLAGSLSPPVSPADTPKRQLPQQQQLDSRRCGQHTRLADVAVLLGCERVPAAISLHSRQLMEHH